MDKTKYSVDDIVLNIRAAIKRRALRDYRAGNVMNPYPEHPVKHNELIKGCRITYDYEIELLIRERLCPCCGQVTRSDIDW